jgi:hypothetical protein
MELGGEKRKPAPAVLLPLDAFNGLPSNTRIMDLKRRLRCDSRSQKGHVDVSVIWASYSARRG